MGAFLRGTVKHARGAVDLAASLVMIAVGTVLLYGYFTKADPPVPGLPGEPVEVTGAFRDGDPSSPTLLIVYSDFQCPYCAQFANQTLPILRDKYARANRLQIVFRDFPLDAIHSHARAAAMAARCAGRVGKFWDMHDRLFQAQSGLAPSDLARHASDLGIDADVCGACMDDAETSRAVEQDISDGRRIGVASTPTLLLATLEPDGRARIRKRLIGAADLARIEREVADIATPGAR